MNAALYTKNKSSLALWILGIITVSLLVLINGFKVQDIAAGRLGYTGPVSIFKLDTLPSYTTDELYKTMDLYGPDGRKVYALLLQTFDMLFPLIYGSFFFLLARKLSRAAGLSLKITNRLSSVALISPVFDWLENISLLITIRAYPQISAAAKFASIFTTTKFIFSLLGLLILLALGAYLIYQKKKVKGDMTY